MPREIPRPRQTWVVGCPRAESRGGEVLPRTMHRPSCPRLPRGSVPSPCFFVEEPRARFIGRVSRKGKALAHSHVVTLQLELQLGPRRAGSRTLRAGPREVPGESMAVSWGWGGAGAASQRFSRICPLSLGHAAGLGAACLMQDGSGKTSFLK